MEKLFFFLMILAFQITHTTQSTAEKEIFIAENEMRKLEEDKSEPYLGGFNSANAHFIQVTMDMSPELYKGRSFKETLRNIQDLLVTGGINTNVFLNKKKEYRIDRSAELQEEKVTFVVNTREQSSRVAQFFREYQAPYMKSVKVTAGKDQIVLEQFDVERPRKAQAKKRKINKKQRREEL